MSCHSVPSIADPVAQQEMIECDCAWGEGWRKDRGSGI